MKVFAYKVIRDYGFAPNPFHGFCTLATCKPHIRDRASTGDIVIGAGSAGRLGERAIFAMRVTDRLSFDQYWNDPRFSKKRPSFFQSEAMAYGDNIYHHGLGGAWIQEDSHHSFVGGALNHENLARDTSVDQVLISDDYVYWGSSGPVLPTEILDHGLPRDYRSSYAEEEVEAIEEWFRSLPRGLLGRPADW